MKGALVLALACAFAAAAQQIKSPEELERIRRSNKVDETTWARPAFSIAPRAGAAFGDLALGPAIALDVAYAPPVLGRQLMLGLETSWTRPQGPGGKSYGVQVDELAPAATASFHWYPDNFPIAPYAGIGAGLCAMRAVTTFNGNSTRTEKELRFALIGLAGLQVRGAGSGTIEAELRIHRTSSRTQVLPDSSVTPLQLTFGYRFPL